MPKPLYQLAPKMRGLYRRVAEKFGVHPSYVGRIARGKRHSPKIEVFLNHEIQRNSDVRIKASNEEEIAWCQGSVAASAASPRREPCHQQRG
jgi:hypothetical protein